jgi:hypothetical protein
MKHALLERDRLALAHLSDRPRRRKGRAGAVAERFWGDSGVEAAGETGARRGIGVGDSVRLIRRSKSSSSSSSLE